MRVVHISSLLCAPPLQGVSGRVIEAQIPYIKQPVPIIIVFRALGLLADKDILEHICYDLSDENPDSSDMMELLRPSLEQTYEISSQEVSPPLQSLVTSHKRRKS